MEELQKMNQESVQADGEHSSASESQENQGQKERTFTQEELNAIVQRRLAEEKEKAAHDADRKALMTLAEREEELSRREAEMRRKEAQSAAEQLLSSKGILPDLASLLDYTSEETIKNGIDILDEVYQQAVQEGVMNALKHDGYNPRRSGGGHITAQTPGDAFLDGLQK